MSIVYYFVDQNRRISRATASKYYISLNSKHPIYFHNFDRNIIKLSLSSIVSKRQYSIVLVSSKLLYTCPTLMALRP